MSDIGFRLADEEDFQRLAERALAAGTTMAARHGAYTCWAPGEGVELWVQTDEDGDVVGLNPHFSGPSRMQIGVTALLPNPDHPLDGSLHAWADPPKDNPNNGWYPFVVDLPDFEVALSRAPCPSMQTIQVAAFAHELRCFADDATYAAAQEDEPRFAPESFIPAGLFRTGPGDAKGSDRPGATAIFAEHILQARLVANPMTGARFHAIAVQTLGGRMDVVADPEIVAGAPVAGGVVKGTFWLSGRIMVP